MFKIFLFVFLYYVVVTAGAILFASMGGLTWGTPEFLKYVMNVEGGATSILVMIGVFWIFIL